MKTLPLFLMLCLLAATAPAWRPAPAAPASGRTTFPGWAAGPVQPAWQPQPLGPREARFARDFPGRTGLFTDDGRTYVVRWLDRPTRKLHPAADCLRAIGYDIEPRPILRRADGSLWSALEATRASERMRVHERIVGADGEWTDVSSWFWHAALGRTQGPWWVVTELVPAAGSAHD